MNFKQLVSKVNLHAGLQGTVTSVGATDYQEYIAEAVRSAWSDIQVQRRTWKFMWETVTFTTDAGVNEYSNASIMTAAGNDFGVTFWDTNNFYKNGNKMTEVSWDIWREFGDQYTDNDDSLYFTIKDYRDAGIILSSPDSQHEIQLDYYRTPQLLESNTDIPLLPEEFHYLIVWRALEDVASYMGNKAIFERHSYKSDLLENKLMRSQVQSKKITKRPIYRKTTHQF